MAWGLAITLSRDGHDITNAKLFIKEIRWVVPPTEENQNLLRDTLQDYIVAETVESIAY